MNATRPWLGAKDNVMFCLFGDHDGRHYRFYTGNTVSRSLLAAHCIDGFIPIVGGRCRTIHQFVGDDATAGNSRRNTGDAALDHAFRLCHSSRKHADLAAIPYDDESRPLVSDRRERGVLERYGTSRSRFELYSVDFALLRHTHCRRSYVQKTNGVT